ncbi:MAG TPA: thiamine pyrophosphate-dependent enzyme [Solirubrobacteraceae bacterium]|nr:thiamine pyrophosphate-dependent enzyme [Solirubrobacteraceae bacterium]
MLPSLPQSEQVEQFRQMWLIRCWEERLIELATIGGETFGHYHVYVGQEAIGVPAIAALRSDDVLFTTHRNHGHLLARGADPGKLLAEIFGKATGLSKGKGGTLHACAPELGIPHTSGIVGGIVPVASGAALAAQKRGGDQVSVAFFGDGAMEEGAVFETLNLAALWKLPLIFLCENNTTDALGAAAGGYPASVIAATDLGDIARSVGVPAVAVAGTDAGAVYDAVAEAVAKARAGEGPTFVEPIVKRWPGSNPLWPALPGGRTKLSYAWEPETAETDEMRGWYDKDDGVIRYIRELLDSGVGREDLEAIDRSVREVVEASVTFAQESPLPDLSEAYTDVFVGEERKPPPPAPESTTREITYAEALVEGLEDQMNEDPKLLIVGSFVLGIGPFRDRFERIRDLFPDRVLDPPTAELAFAGAGIGAALTGTAAMVDCGTASFVYQASPQIANEVANSISMSGGRLRAPVVFHYMHGLRGGGAAQHSHSPQAMLWNAPGLKIVVPSSPYDVKGLIRTAFENGSPTVVADHSKLLPLTGPVPEEAYTIPFGSARVRRPGSDVTIVATSYVVHEALLAAEAVAGEGIDAEVLDPRTLVPLDHDAILESVAKTGRLVVVDEGHLSCGVGSEIAAIVAEEGFDLLKAPIRRVATPDVPIPFSPVLEAEIAPYADKIAAAVRALTGTGVAA